MKNIIDFLTIYPLLIISITIHEYAHALVAEKRGDTTPRSYGRVTLNPLAHIDPIGTILLPIFALIFKCPVVGWAKPVPVNQYNFYDPKRDMILVALAGPFANFLLAAVASSILYLLRAQMTLFELMDLMKYLITINTILMVFNLLPIPPLDGSRILTAILPYRYLIRYEVMLPFSIFIIWFLLYTGMLWKIISPIVNLLLDLFGVKGYYV